MKFSVASFHNVGSFTFTADDGCWFPLFVEGVVDVNRVTRLKGLRVIVCVTLVSVGGRGWIGDGGLSQGDEETARDL